MSIDPREFRNALGCFATGVTIITTLGENNERIGITASSFNSVSVDPPLVLWSLGRSAYSLPAFAKAGHFAVNVLALDQTELSNRFARAGADKWSGVETEAWETGAPILPGCVANFQCLTEHTINGGDHMVFIGRVTRMRHDFDRAPLLFHRGRYNAVLDSGASTS